MRYYLFGSIGLIASQNPFEIRHRLAISCGEEEQVYVNGVGYEVVAGTAWVPKEDLRSMNTVRLVSHGVGYRCQPFAFNGTTVTPCPLLYQEIFCEMARALSESREEIAALTEQVSQLKREQEKPLFS